MPEPRFDEGEDRLNSTSVREGDTLARCDAVTYVLSLPRLAVILLVVMASTLRLSIMVETVDAVENGVRLRNGTWAFAHLPLTIQREVMPELHCLHDKTPTIAGDRLLYVSLDSSVVGVTLPSMSTITSTCPCAFAGNVMTMMRLSAAGDVTLRITQEMPLHLTCPTETVILSFCKRLSTFVTSMRNVPFCAEAWFVRPSTNADVGLSSAIVGGS